MSRTSVAAACVCIATALSMPAAAPQQSQPPRAPANPPVGIQRPQPSDPQPREQPQPTGQPPQQPARIPQPFRGQANLVRVDVYATKGGAPIGDLTAADLQVFEDGKPQAIESFEHIVVQPALGEAEMKEPGSTREAMQAVADPHRRAFVVFLDNNFVDVGGSHNIKQPLIDLLTRILGADDLVGLMTPDMSPSQITFARKTDVIDRGLIENWAWGKRDSIMLDPVEQDYVYCFPKEPGELGAAPWSKLAGELIQRKRERQTLESLQDLVRYMQNVRDGRTAVIAITAGWMLYRPDQSITRLRQDPNGNPEPIPGMPPPPGMGPGGTLTVRGTRDNPYSDTKYKCDADRMQLAMVDNDQFFRQIIDDANRANVSFYPIDPRGLPVFDTPIGPEAPPPVSVDAAMLHTRQDNLRVLADNTDGIALLNNNDLSKQMRRVADDLTSYYLIGYYSTNAKLDGKFRSIKVASKRPGVEIRARRGYRAATADEVAAARTASDAPKPDTNAALTSALGALDRSARGGVRRAPGEPLVLHRGPTTGNSYKPADASVFPRSDRLRFEMDGAQGDTLSATLLTRAGTRLTIPIPTTERTDGDKRVLIADLTLAPLGAGDYVVELTVTKGAEHRTVLTAVRVTQ